VMKGHRVVVEAAARWLAAAVRARFVLVGRGSMEDAIRERVTAAGLTDRVTIAGFADDLPAVMSALDVALYVPLESDGMSRVVFEYLAAARPLVASRVGVVPEVLTDGDHALLVHAGDAAALADALGRLLRDAALRDKLGQRGRRLVVERYSGAQVAGALESHYQDLDPRLRPVGQRDRSGSVSGAAARPAARGDDRGAAIRRRAVAARPRERRNLPLAAGPTLSRVRDRPRGAGPPGRRRCPLRVEAAADELRDRIARPPTAAPPVAPGHRRLVARILLSLGGVGTSRSRAQRRQPQRAALDVALRARGEARRRRHSGLALSRVTLRRHPDPSRARHRRLGSGALRPCRGASPARSRPPSGRDVPGHASGLQGRGRSGR